RGGAVRVPARAAADAAPRHRPPTGAQGPFRSPGRPVRTAPRGTGRRPAGQRPDPGGDHRPPGPAAPGRTAPPPLPRSDPAERVTTVGATAPGCVVRIEGVRFRRGAERESAAR